MYRKTDKKCKCSHHIISSSCNLSRISIRRRRKCFNICTCHNRTRCWDSIYHTRIHINNFIPISRRSARIPRGSIHKPGAPV